MSADPEDRNGPPPQKDDPTETEAKEAQAAIQRKLYEAARGHVWHFRYGSTRAHATMGTDCAWHVNWQPRAPKTDTPQGARIWGAYFAWRNGWAQEIVNSAGAKMTIIERIDGALIVQNFQPQPPDHG